MEAQKVDMFLLANGDKLPAMQIPMIREQLLALDDSKWTMISALQLKSTTTALILSLLLGAYGIDRFYIGDTGLGIGKLLTCGGCGIWAIIDWFKISDDTRMKNFNLLQSYLLA